MKILISVFAFSFVFGLNAQSTFVIKPDSTTGNDAEVFSNNPTANYENQPGMAAYTWTNNSNLGIKRIYLYFDWFSLPNNAIVDSARLDLFYSSNNSEAFSVHTGQTDFYVERVLSAWIESNITWNNQPATSTVNRVAVPAHLDSTQNYQIDVSALVADMMSSNRSNNGFCIKMQNENTPYRGILLASSEHSNPALHPTLRIFYHVNTSIAELESTASKTTIFPNPSKDVFYVNLPEGSIIKDWKISVLDQTGKLVSEGQVNEPMPKETLSPGLYYIKLEHALGYSFLKKHLIIAP